jgi:hypothetical protein
MPLPSRAAKPSEPTDNPTGNRRRRESIACIICICLHSKKTGGPAQVLGVTAPGLTEPNGLGFGSAISKLLNFAANLPFTILPIARSGPTFDARFVQEKALKGQRR